MRLLFLLVMIVAVLFVAVVVVGARPTGWQWLSLIPSALLAIAATLMTRASISIVIDAHGVVLRFWPLFRRTIRFEEISAHGMTMLQARDFAGLGYRYAGPRAQALLFDAGPGVELSLHDGTRLLVRSSAPEQLSAVLDAVAPDARSA